VERWLVGIGNILQCSTLRCINTVSDGETTTPSAEISRTSRLETNGSILPRDLDGNPHDASMHHCCCLRVPFLTVPTIHLRPGWDGCSRDVPGDADANSHPALASGILWMLESCWMLLRCSQCLLGMDEWICAGGGGDVVGGDAV